MALEAAELRARLQQLRSPLSVRKAAERIGVAETTWMRWENGKNRPGPEAIEALAEAFQVDPSYITGSPEYVGPLARLEAKLDLLLELAGADPDELADRIPEALEQLAADAHSQNGTAHPTSERKRRGA